MSNLPPYYELPPFQRRQTERRHALGWTLVAVTGLMLVFGAWKCAGATIATPVVGDGGDHLSIGANASDIWIVGCTFDGSAYRAIHSWGRDVHVQTSGVHGSSQNSPAAPASFSSDGIKMVGSGMQEVRNCVIRNVGGMGVLFQGVTAAGDRYLAQGNMIENCGQAGVSAFKTRGFGTGTIRQNRIVGCNRLCGTPGAGGNGACGIHLNDGVQAGVDPSKPFVRWTVSENTVWGCAAPASPRHEDSGGIALDFNSNGAIVERNVIYGNWGKAVYAYNCDRAIIRDNVCTGNDSGIVVSTGGGAETCVGVQVTGNLLAGNYNGPDRGPGYDTELLFLRAVNATCTGNRMIPVRRSIWLMDGNVGLGLSGNIDLRTPVAVATPTPTPTRTWTPTPTATRTPTRTATPTVTPTPRRSLILFENGNEVWRSN